MYKSLKSGRVVGIYNTAPITDSTLTWFNNVKYSQTCFDVNSVQEYRLSLIYFLVLGSLV